MSDLQVDFAFQHDFNMKAEKKSALLPSPSSLTKECHGLSAYMPIKKIFFS